MKISTLMLIVSLVGLSGISNIAVASNKNAAVTKCKQHILGLYGDDIRVSLKKTQQKKAFVEVKMKVRMAGEKFTARCEVTNDGILAYTSNKKEDQLVLDK